MILAQSITSEPVKGMQIVLLGVVVILFLLTIAAGVRGWIGRGGAIAWTLLWITAGVAIAYPNVTVVVASAMGIGRGADLVLYLSVVAMMAGFLMVYVRLRRVRRDVTLLVRRLAIEEGLKKP